MKYLKVIIDTPYDLLVRYTPLEDGRKYTSGDLLDIGQDVVNSEFQWSMEEVDESEVPEEERVI